MPTSATGTWVSSRPGRSPAQHPPAGGASCRGFTLLELLVVMVIIAIVTAGALLSLGSTDNDAQLNEERDRLSALIDYVRERAALATTEYGLQVAHRGYRFCFYDTRTGAWQPESLDDVLRARELPAGLEFTLDVEGRKVVLDESLPQAGAGSDQLPDFTPQIMLYANGDTNDFALSLQRQPQARGFTVRSKGAGEIEFGKIGSPPT